MQQATVKSQPPWRWNKRLYGVVIVVLIIGQFVFGLSFKHRWIGPLTVYNQIFTSNWSLQFGRDTDSHQRLFAAVQLDNCSDKLANLTGPIPVNMVAQNWIEIVRANSNVEPGGLWRPRDCLARHHVAIIVPFRDRESHLKIFISHMHKFLQKQQLNYGIYIVEEALPTRFNRAMLLNIGYVEASKQASYSCYIFHDVDLLPENDHNIYSCPEQPRHMSVAVDKFKYRLPYKSLVGGVCAIKADHFKMINGFSNKFFGWGGEDDDFFNRIISHKLYVERYSVEIARYKMIKHLRERLNAANARAMYLLSHSKERFATDGLNSLKYKLLAITKKPLYTWIYVNISE